ncbi:PAS domain-containing protein [Siccirubricoccus sp. KC 17139]|uniref:histidine kinase n=1 Tax=Siccirubricoccus soli TaxID=2899147 RepID=A0ABT1DE15_9PROT|nr:PAS domain-containing protein [Siccirubricoccus soli]MCP2685355.1 PAS domain-containing protein [Siccirubricoccus soli]
MELSPLIPWSADPQGLVTDVGTRWCERTGMTAEETLGTGFAAAVHPDDAPELLDWWQSSVQTGEPFTAECRYRQADGSYCWVHVRAAARRDDEGRILRWYGTLEDIQDRKLAELALRESEEHYRHFVELNPQYPWSANEEGQADQLSSRWLSLLGMTQEQAAGTGWLDAVHPEDLPAVLTIYHQAKASGEPFDYEARFRMADER